ncbi:lytic transglycosylase domain-containing protein [Aromatoleum toluclasticum]|uniref:lytic transglycosylase domain-containing protein n=1 Tax=Aromatoleum toluclasticum TaxID=92003 RepID=UPI001D18A5F2|nr:lytic transglycosylase domain-containing protein [Aromatoleum toluclasticum]MCC4113904.1 lytic transglycosylase domain-containing protein [Aromatoleum toluclasticum]
MAAPVAARAALVLLLGIQTSATSAQEVPPPAYQLAAQQAGVPSPVLYAVALQESGTRLRGRLIPWPWTLNVAGRAERYATRAQACAGLRKALASTPGHRIDAGLGQVNLGYHTQRYVHPCELLDPYRNLAVAAEILREQHMPGEDWLVAIGRYHRPAGGAPAARYRRSVHLHLARMLGPGASAISTRTTTP